MTSPTTRPAPSGPRSQRVLHSWWLPVALVVVASVASLLALRVQDDATDTALGAVAGAAVVLALFVLLVQVLAARARRAGQGQGDLDGLEPLRAARRDSEGGTR